MNITLSTFPNIKSNKPKTITRPLEVIVESLLKPLEGVGSKDSVSLWSPTVFSGTRSRANAVSVGMLVYDIDDGIAPVDSWRLFHKNMVLCHTSYSHKANHHKYRIILPLYEPIPAEDWPRASIAAKEYWDHIVGRGEPDSKALKDVARIYYRYAIPRNQYTAGHPLKYLHTDWFHYGDLLKLEYKHVDLVEPSKSIKPYKINGKRSMQDVVLDKSFRIAAAEKLGARIVGNEARYITCPNCNRKSVHFSIDLSFPQSYKWPTCNHDGKCKYWGNFEDLLGGLL